MDLKTRSTTVTGSAAGTAAFLSLLTLGVAPAIAQQAADEPSSGFVIEEVVVTAQKREENLQETPISITALGEAQIEDRGIKNVKDMFSSAPGVAGYEAPSSRGNIGVSLRGIGSGNASNLSIDPANGVYIDGVYLGKAAGLGVDAMDLQRIEILRGPQGTLYGRNSTGGAINFITAKPRGDFGVKLAASAGSEGMQEYKVRFDVPFSENFLTSFSYQNRERDHLYNNVNPNSEGFENINREGYRFAVRFEPSDNFRLDYSFDHSEIDEEVQALDMVSFNPAGAGVLVADGFPENVTINSSDRRNTVAAIQGGFQQSLNFGLIPSIPQTVQFNQWMIDWLDWASTNATGGSGREGLVGAADSPHNSTNENEGHALTLTWNVDDTAWGDIEFKSITGFRTMDNLNQGDVDGQDNTVDSGIIFHGTLQAIGGAYFGQFPGIPPATQFALANAMVDSINARGRAETFTTYQMNDYEQFSQELQMVGSTDTVDYAVGLFYFDDEGERRSNSTATFPLSSTFANDYDNSGTAWSIYSQVTWLPDIESRWSFTGGIRYTEEEKNVLLLHRANGVPGGFVGAFFAGIPFADLYADPEDAQSMPEVPGVFGRSFSEDFDNVSGKLTVAYNFSDTVNGFLTHSTGYRSGFFNGEAFDAVNDTADQVGEETITSTELGIKADFWGGRARMNASYFTYTYDDQQVSTLSEDMGVVTSRTSNAGKTDRDGVEIELTLLPLEDLQLNLNYTHLSTDHKEFPPLIASQAAGGASLEQVDLVTDGLMPSTQVTFNADWTIAEFSNGGLLNFNINGAWQDEGFPIGINGFIYNAIPDAASTPDTPVVHEQLSLDERTVINARLALNELPVGDGTLSIGVWGRNLTDDDHRSFSFNFGAGLGLNLAQYGEEATYGFDLIYRY